MENWANFPDSIPTESGYYMTYYYNPQQDEYLYKALSFDVKIGKWLGPWSWSYDLVEALSTDGKACRRYVHKGIDVKRYVPESRTDFYTQCEYGAK